MKNSFTLRPELLLHPRLPAALHGLAPRIIKGKKWWDEKRQEAYAKNDYCCWACGIHKNLAVFKQHLEAHESYEIDYKTGRMELKEVVALCNSCHNFIHSGRLTKMYFDGVFLRSYVESVLKHGISVLHDAKLPMNGHALTCAEETGIAYASTTVLVMANGVKEHPESAVAWSDWRLVIEGVEYALLWKNEQEHEAHYSKLNKEAQ